MRNAPGRVFRCKELYFASFTPNLMPPGALLRDRLLPLLAAAAATTTTAAAADDDDDDDNDDDSRPVVVLIDRGDLRELYPVDSLRPRRRLINHREVLRALEDVLSAGPPVHTITHTHTQSHTHTHLFTPLHEGS